MRKELKKMDTQREVFTGVFSKYGIKSNYKGPSTDTLLLMNIRDEAGAIVTDHLWFNLTKGFEKLGSLKKGDRIRFEARVKRYKKGYVNRKIGIDQQSFDYKLSHPTKMEKM